VGKALLNLSRTHLISKLSGFFPVTPLAIAAL
jgi:hypothetical protein